MNNKINIENYEAFLLDWTEGTLSSEDVVLLKKFLKNHPEIKLDDDLLNQTLNTADIYFSEKNMLKKSLSDDDYIAYHEGDLSSLKKQEIEEYIITDTNAKNDFELYAKLKLQAQQIVFPNKLALKKKGVVFTFKRVAYYASAIAAIFVLAFLLFKDTTSIYIPKTLTVNNDVKNTLPIQEESFKFLIPKEKSVQQTKKTTVKLIAQNDEKIIEKREKTINEDKLSDKIVTHQSTETEELNNRIEAYFDYMNIVQEEEKNVLAEENTAPEKLTVKEFLVSKFKKHILKVDDETPTKLEVNDFAKTLASVSNNKIFIETNGVYEHLKMQTKLFSFDKKISN